MEMRRTTRRGCGWLALAAAAGLAGCGSGRSDGDLAPAPVTAGIPGSGVGARGGVNTLTEDDLGRQNVFRLEELLQGRVPGVRVLRGPNGTFALRIRGGSSISGNNEPLYVIDGMPVPSGSFGSVLASFSPSDVVRIEVLKDANASLYGSRGANGVVVISTTR